MMDDKSGRKHIETTDVIVAHRRQAASDPTTTPDQLRNLVAHSGMRRLVVSNPNAPLDLLLELAEEYPAGFLANPALPFLLIEQPNLLSRLSDAAAGGILRLEEAPNAIVKLLAAHPTREIAFAAGLHITMMRDFSTANWLDRTEKLFNAPPEHNRLRYHLGIIIRTLATEEEALPFMAGGWNARAAVFRWLAAIHFPPASASLQKEDVPQVAESVGGWPLELVRSGSVAPAILSEIGATGNIPLRRAVARNPLTPVSTLLQLSSDPIAKVRCGVAENPKTDAAILLRLAADPDVDVRAAVAFHPATPPEALSALVKDQSIRVRKYLAQHVGLPVKLCIRLLHDQDEGVRQAAISQAPPDVLEANFGKWLGSDLLRSYLALNPHLDSGQIMEIVRSLAARSTLDALTARRLATHPSADTGVLNMLSHWKNADVQCAVISNPRIIPTILYALLHTAKSSQTLAALASSTRLSFGTATTLVGRADTPESRLAILGALFRRPDATPEWRAELLKQLYQNGLMRGADEPDYFAAYMLATPYLDTEEYAAAGNAAWWVLRLMVALNPAAPPETLAALTHDGNVCVRAAARATLVYLLAHTSALHME